MDYRTVSSTDADELSRKLVEREQILQDELDRVTGEKQDETGWSA